MPSRLRQAVSSARQQADDESEHVLHQAHAAAHPAHGAGQLDGVAANLIGRLHHARRLLGVRNDLFKHLEGARQPRRQAVRQQAEGGVALRAVPAGDLRAAGEPRVVAKLHRSRPGGYSPARASFSLRVVPPRID